MSKQFARIIDSSDGHQVLFYVEPEDGDFFLHQVANHEDFQADMKICFTSQDADENERRAYAVLGAVDQHSADKVIEIVIRMIGGTPC